MSKKRYVATISFYIYSDTDNNATKEAERIARILRDNYDNAASVEEITSVPFVAPFNGKEITKIK